MQPMVSRPIKEPEYRVAAETVRNVEKTIRLHEEIAWYAFMLSDVRNKMALRKAVMPLIA